VRLRILAFAVLALSAPLAGTPSPASARQGSGADPCVDAACRAQLMVGAELTRFRSRESFDAAGSFVSVRVSAAGRELRESSSAGVDGCRRTLRGGGVIATVSTCAGAAPVRVSALRVYGRPDYIQISYRCFPYLGSEDGGDSSDGGATAA